MISITCLPLGVSRLAVGSSARIRAGFGGQGAGDGHALLLPAAQLVRAVVGAVGQVDRFEQLGDPLAALGRALPVQQQRHFDVLIGRQGGDEGKELEDKADRAAAHIGALVAVELADVLAVDEHLPAGGLVQAADQLQQGGLARAGRPDQGGKFAAFDGQVDAAQGLGFDLANLVNCG